MKKLKTNPKIFGYICTKIDNKFISRMKRILNVKGNFIYIPLLVQRNNLKSLKKLLLLMDIKGANISPPLRILIKKYIDKCDSSKKVEAIVVQGRKILGFPNTDFPKCWGIK